MIIQDNPVRDLAKLFAWYPLRWTVSASPWALAYAMGVAVGRVYCAAFPGKVRRIAANMRTGLGEMLTDSEAFRHARMVVIRHYVEHMEFYKLASLTSKTIGRHLNFQGVEHLDEAMAAGKGAILVHLHFGSKQFPLVGLGLLGYPVTQVGYRDAHAADYSFIHRKVHLRLRMRIEDLFPAKHIHLGQSMRPLIRSLENNEILMIAGDGVGGIRRPGANYLPTDFLGQVMLFPPGPAKLARLTNAPILPLFCIQDTGRWSYTARILPPIQVEISGDAHKAAAATTARMAAVFELMIRQHPDHWMFWEEFEPGHLLQSPRAGMPSPVP